jgi:hypothetical protein
LTHYISFVFFRSYNMTTEVCARFYHSQKNIGNSDEL